MIHYRIHHRTLKEWAYKTPVSILSGQKHVYGVKLNTVVGSRSTKDCAVVYIVDHHGPVHAAVAIESGV